MSFFIPVHLCAQAFLLDSLHQLATTLPADTSKVNVWNNLSWEYHRVDVEKTFLYGEKALQLAQKLNYQKGEARALNLLAIAYSTNKGDNVKSLELNQKAHEIAKEINDLSLLSSTLNDMAISYSNDGKYQKALQLYQQSLETDEKRGVFTYYSFTLGNIGSIHAELGNLDKAEEYAYKALKAARQHGDPKTLCAAYFGVGYSLEDRNDYDSAYIYYQKGYELAIETGDKTSIAQGLGNIGYVENIRGNHELAITKLMEAIEYNTDLKDIENLSFDYLTLSDIFIEQKKFDEAIYWTKKGLDYFESNGQLGIQPFLNRTLADTYEKVGETEKALAHYKAFTALNDSLRIKEEKVLMTELETKYQAEKKEAENEILLAENEKNQAIIRQQDILFITIGIIFVLLGILGWMAYITYKQNKKINLSLEEQVQSRTEQLELKNEELKKTIEELERFNYIASHDIKEPIRVVSNMAGMIQRRLPDSIKEEFAEDFTLIKNNAKQLYTLLEDLAAFSSTKKDLVKIEPVDLNILANNQKGLLSEKIKSKNALIDFNKLPIIYSSSSSLSIIFKNLIENGIKYNEQLIPAISIRYKKTSDKHHLIFKDNGIGIEEIYFQKIFDMFTRLNGRKYTGSGIGLYLVKMAIQQLEGNIEMESKLGEGTVFHLTFPILHKKDVTLENGVTFLQK